MKCYATKKFICACLQTLLKLLRPKDTQAPSVKMRNDHSPHDFGFQQEEKFLPIVHLNVEQFKNLTISVF